MERDVGELLGNKGFKCSANVAVCSDAAAEDEGLCIGMHKCASCFFDKHFRCCVFEVACDNCSFVVSYYFIKDASANRRFKSRERHVVVRCVEHRAWKWWEKWWEIFCTSMRAALSKASPTASSRVLPIFSYAAKSFMRTNSV